VDFVRKRKLMCVSRELIMLCVNAPYDQYCPGHTFYIDRRAL
jgi:hypothetical protein